MSGKIKPLGLSSPRSGTGVSARKRAIPVPSEQEEQEAIFAWARNPLVLRGQPDLAMLISTQPGMRVSIGTAVKAKRAGMPKGFPDLFLAVPRGRGLLAPGGLSRYCGLFIELKRRLGGVLSAEQKEWAVRLGAQGYAVRRCDGASAAIKVIEAYLEGRL